MTHNEPTGRPEPMRVLVLGRLSKKLRDGKQTGLETQDAGMVTWAGHEGHTVTAVVGDFKSGTVQPWKRPNARPWLTDPGKIAQYDAVAAWRFDRLSRGDKQSTNEIEEWARKNGKMLLTEDGLVFPSEGVDGIRWDISARMAHDEWMKIRERAMRAQTKLRHGGYLVGRAPYGYRIVVVDGAEHKTLEHDPVTGPVVQEMARRYLAGETLQAICDVLNARPVPGPGFKRDKDGQRTDQPALWIPKTLSQVLRNPAIAGRRKDGLKFDGLVTVADYDAIIRRMDSRAHRKGISPKNVKLLTSVLFCGVCRLPMYAIKTRDGVFYYCKSRKGCKMLIPVAATDADFDAWLHATLPDWEIPQTVTIPGDDHQNQIDQLERDASELKMTDDDFIGRVTAIREQIIHLTETAEPPRQDVRMMRGSEIVAMWDGADTARRRDVLLATGLKIYATKDADGNVKYAIERPSAI